MAAVSPDKGDTPYGLLETLCTVLVLYEYSIVSECAIWYGGSFCRRARRVTQVAGVARRHINARPVAHMYFAPGRFFPWASFSNLSLQRVSIGTSLSSCLSRSGS